MTLDQFLFYLKSKNINYKDYDYIEDHTTESYMEKHPLIIKYRRFYDNPHLWNLLFSDSKYDDGIDFLISYDKVDLDSIIINSILLNTNKDKQSIILDLVKRSLSESKYPVDDLDSYLYASISGENYDRFEDLIQIGLDLNIQPKYKSFGNFSSGQGFYEAARSGSMKMIKRLLDLGGDASIDSSMGYIMCMKSANYSIAKLLIDNGADIHTKNNLGLKLIERNDKRQVKLSEENELARRIILEKYNNEV